MRGAVKTVILFCGALFLLAFTLHLESDPASAQTGLAKRKPRPTLAVLHIQSPTKGQKFQRGDVLTIEWIQTGVEYRAQQGRFPHPHDFAISIIKVPGGPLIQNYSSGIERVITRRGPRYRCQFTLDRRFPAGSNYIIKLTYRPAGISRYDRPFTILPLSGRTFGTGR